MKENLWKAGANTGACPRVIAAKFSTPPYSGGPFFF